MASTSHGSCKSVEDAEIFQVLEEKRNSTTRPSTRGINCTTTYRKFLGKWHHIYFDNFFSSTNLMKMLLEQETYSCGTYLLTYLLHVAESFLRS